MAEIGKDIEKARVILQNGGLVAIPTETVYGLAGNAFDADAVVKIFKVKNRPSFDPMITHTDHLDKVRGFVREIPDLACRLAKAFWPGPLTLLLEKTEVIPDIVTSGLDTVAVRIPDHPLTLELLHSLDFPLAAPSANPFGYVSPTMAAHVEEQLGNSIPYVLDGGPCRIGIESTIIGFEGKIPVIFRLGGKIVEEIEKIVGTVKIRDVFVSRALAPGMLESHYSPSKKVLYGEISDLIQNFTIDSVGIIAFKKRIEGVPEFQQYILSESGDIEEAGKNLFSGLRYLDKLDIEVILAEPVPDQGLGRAINDRLMRAASVR